MEARSRLTQIGLCTVTIALGLASRRPGLPAFVLNYAGDALYAVLIYWLVGLIRPMVGAGKGATIAWVICAAIEISQTIHAPWLDELRANRLGALVLGRGFLWSDLICYAVGSGGAALAEWALGRRK